MGTESALFLLNIQLSVRTFTSREISDPRRPDLFSHHRVLPCRHASFQSRPFSPRRAGSFGCIADCGLSTVKTSVVTITVMASFRLNSQITQSLQESFVATTRWNLCFLSNYTNTETKLCWYEEPRIFATATETQQVILNLPDADWSVRARAIMFFPL